MILFLRAISLFLSLVSTGVWACDSMDILDKFGEPRNQDGAGWCEGYAFSDLLSFHLGAKVSAQDLSISSVEAQEASLVKAIQGLQRNIADCREKKQRLRNGDAKEECELTLSGHPAFLKFDQKKLAELRKSFFDAAVKIGDMMNTLKSLGGICLESDFPSDHFAGDPLPEPQTTDVLAEALTRRYKDLNHDLTKNLCTDAEEVIHQLIPHQVSPDFLEILKRSKKETRPLAVRNEACRERHHLDKLNSLRLTELHVGEDTHPPEALVTINGALEKKEPVLLGLDMRFATAFDCMECEHALLIVGRRAGSGANGGCEYHVRNSWGRDCSGLKSPFRESCSNGSFWISEKDITSHMLSVATLTRNEEGPLPVAPP